jgi:hypothetical protein
VSHGGGKWTIAGKKQTIILNESDLALAVRAGPDVWAMVPSGPHDMLAKARGEEFSLRLADANRLVIVPYDTGFKTGMNPLHFSASSMSVRCRLDLQTCPLALPVFGRGERPCSLWVSSPRTERSEGVVLLAVINVSAPVK